MRLKELEMAGLIERVEKRRSPIMVLRALTEKGIDALAIEVMIVGYGSKWNADNVFFDRKSQKLHEISMKRE